jgi:hypothetical protein
MATIVPRCPVCKHSLKLKQNVILDMANGLIHEECSFGWDYKDKGTVEEMLNKHEFILGELKEYIK